MTEQKTCGQCEYFDGEYGDCLSHNSDRFQTSVDSPACVAFYPTTAKRVADSDGGECD